MRSRRLKPLQLIRLRSAASGVLFAFNVEAQSAPVEPERNLSVHSSTSPASTIVRPGHFANRIWLLVGGLALVGVGLAAGMAWHPAPQSDLLSAGPMEGTRASLASDDAMVDTTVKVAAGNAAAPTVELAPQDGPAVRSPAPAFAHPAALQKKHVVQAAPEPVAAPVCAHCGVIESVHAVQQKGKGTGLGAVAGGVLGGALGNNMGRGNGRTAMTVLGAIGGGLAGNEVEKRARSEVIYDVRVHMDDGSTRTLALKTAPTVGSRVTVDGQTLHPLAAQ